MTINSISKNLKLHNNLLFFYKNVSENGIFSESYLELSSSSFSFGEPLTDFSEAGDSTPKAGSTPSVPSAVPSALRKLGMLGMLVGTLLSQPDICVFTLPRFPRTSRRLAPLVGLQHKPTNVQNNRFSRIHLAHTRILLTRHMCLYNAQVSQDIQDGQTFFKTHYFALRGPQIG